jgi:transposase-like protein
VNGASVYERIQTGRSPERIFQMPKKRYDVDQIIPMLRRADVELGKGRKVPEVCKMLGIVQQTYYRWRQKYGSMAPEMARELKALQKENSQLKKLVADQALDNAILKEAAKGNF